MKRAAVFIVLEQETPVKDIKVIVTKDATQGIIGESALKVKLCVGRFNLVNDVSKYSKIF